MTLTKLCRFEIRSASGPRVGVIVNDKTVMDLTSVGVRSMRDLLERGDLNDTVDRLTSNSDSGYSLDSVRLLTPVESQEVWAAGVTYLRSKDARMVESEFSASAYDRVYAAVRPEIFFKSLPEKVVSPGE